MALAFWDALQLNTNVLNKKLKKTPLKSSMHLHKKIQSW